MKIDSYKLTLLAFAILPFSFLPGLYIQSIPVVQVYLALAVFCCFALNLNIFASTKDSIPSYFYLITSLPALLISLFEGLGLSYIYFFLVILMFSSSRVISISEYRRLLRVALFSLTVLVVIGWLIRLGYLRWDLISSQAVESEFLLGYWGLRYAESTRNADYIYPLVGLCISLYFYKITRYPMAYFLIAALMQFTLISSMSRAAIILAALSIFYLLAVRSNVSRTLGVLTIFICIYYFFDLLENVYLEIYSIIIKSIFTTDSFGGRFSNAGRIEIVQQAIVAALYNPIGYGVDNYQSMYNIFGYRSSVFGSAENAFLTILIERGWLAFIAFIYLLYDIYRKIKKYENVVLGGAFTSVFLPFLTFYFMFNYELNNIFANFIFLLAFIEIRTLRNEYRARRQHFSAFASVQ